MSIFAFYFVSSKRSKSIFPAIKIQNVGSTKRINTPFLAVAPSSVVDYCVGNWKLQFQDGELIL